MSLFYRFPITHLINYLSKIASKVVFLVAVVAVDAVQRYSFAHHSFLFTNFKKIKVAPAAVNCR